MPESGSSAGSRGLPAPVAAFADQEGETCLLGPVLADPGQRGRFARVLLTVADRGELRAARLPHAVRAPAVGVWVRSAIAAPGLVPRPEWPAMKAFRAQPVGEGYLVVARFEQPVRAANVVRELGRQSVWPAPGAALGLVVDDGSGPELAYDERDVPPDVLLAAPAAPLDPHHVTGRAPVVVSDLPGLSGPLTVGPLDERVLNPIGFLADAPDPVLTWDALVSGRAGDLEPREALVCSLRAYRGVVAEVLDRPEGARLVAGLAMAGTPISAGAVSPAVAALLGEAVTAALLAPADLADPVAREEHSIVLRRAALRTFSAGAWRRAVAAMLGVRVAEPAVSVVLATKRPDQLAFALSQVAGQRGVEPQLVLAPHGFVPDAAEVRELAGPSLADRLVVVPQGEEVLFGDVLAAAVAAADGDLVLKMDDDDWYGPDFVADLLLARDYSGAELVGAPSEFHYLVPKDVTVRRGHAAELYAHFVAGGTMLIERGLLREVGSFRAVRRFVDAQLLAAVTAAGAAIYRTHGFGYLLRRNASGHTWEVDMDYLLDPARVAEIRPGFAPSRLLLPDFA